MVVPETKHHVPQLPLEATSLASALCSQVLGDVPGIVASEAGSPLSLLVKMHHLHNTVIELKGDSSLTWAAVEAVQTACIVIHFDLA